MELLTDPKFDFIGKGKLTLSLSLLAVLVSAGLLATKGFNYGIDFSGGVQIRLGFDQDVPIDAVRDALKAAGQDDVSLQSITGHNEIQLRAPGTLDTTAEVAETLHNVIDKAFPDRTATLRSQEFVDAVVGEHLASQALWAIGLSLLGIILYVAFRFSNLTWGVAGVIALGHDVLILLGLLSLMQKEINLSMVAAVLTLAGYSINDTIVILDRIREKLHLRRRDGLPQVFNAALNETLSRTAITSFTTLLAVGCILFAGGEVIHDFAFAIFVGIFVGTYSSLGIVSPLVLLWEQGNRPQLVHDGGAHPAGGGKSHKKKHRR